MLTLHHRNKAWQTRKLRIACAESRLQTQRDFAEAVECRFEVLDDFGGDLVGRREQVGIVERVVLEPEDVEIDLVAGDELGLPETPEAFAFGTLVPPSRFEAGDEIVEIGPRHRP